jgi:hypothetical protein
MSEEKKVVAETK